MNNPKIEVVRSNGHASLPKHLKGEWLVVAIQDGQFVGLASRGTRNEAVQKACIERRMNSRIGPVHYACGFYVIQDDGSWVSS